jgi:hypothetical protein
MGNPGCPAATPARIDSNDPGVAVVALGSGPLPDSVVMRMPTRPTVAPVTMLPYLTRCFSRERRW